MATKEKPEKPRKDFPLTANGNGQWSKKVHGRVHYFGVWADPVAAEGLYNLQREDLEAGRKPKVMKPGTGVTVRDVINRFLTAKQALVDVQELSPITWHVYRDTCELVIKQFGKERQVTDLSVEDFETLRTFFAKGRGPVSVGNNVRHTRIVFKYAYDAGLIDLPMRFGPHFKPPGRRVLRKARHESGLKSGLRMFEAADLRTIIDMATPTMRAMVLLGINCGFGQTDVARIKKSAIDLKAGFVTYPRPKTEIMRRIPLWPETLDAVRKALKVRPEPKAPEDAELVFVTLFGQRWVRYSNGVLSDAIGNMFSRLLTDLSLKRSKLSFYALRHTFETIAGASKDQIAVDAIMGHADGSMSALYRERIEDERLLAVTNFVRAWLWPDKAAARPKRAKTAAKE